MTSDAGVMHVQAGVARMVCTENQMLGLDTLVANPRERLFGFEIDAIDMREAVERIYEWVSTGEKSCRFVVTPNVDHAVLYQQHPGLRQAYSHAALVLADGAPVVVAARLLGRRLPGRVAGSDLAPALFEA
jgi:N-acetylglucosaminyldiphosphoundecaprenol N-acetyl-beta-D-mannosaminyltransferase